MRTFKRLQTATWLIILCLVISATGYAGVREYRIHDRGMIHETVYNTGTIGRPWIVYAKTNLPLMEWPPRSRTIINGVEHDGHHNIYGAGIYISANEIGLKGEANRIFAFCGGTGERQVTELPFGRWSFPISMEEIENFPIIEGQDGHGMVNPDYNPDEAEEIIIAKWSTPTGITVTRTSRVWSYPDFDDIIIYEYQLVYTGDTDGELTTVERTEDLVDVLFHVTYGFGPTKLAYEMWYDNLWFYGDPGGIYRADLRYSFDPDYWLLWSTNTHTKFPDENVEMFAAKPMPDKSLFMEFATTGKNGGGLLGASCPGYAMLYWDHNHLAKVDTDPEVSESEYTGYLIADKFGNRGWEIDGQGHIKQPWNMKTGTPRSASVKMIDRACGIDERWWTVYGEKDVFDGVPSDGNRFVLPTNPRTGEARAWKGRARYEWDESYNGGLAIQGFGPYTIQLGDTLEFAVAEVVGYGGTPDKICCGGQRDKQFYPVRDWNRRVEIDGDVLTEAYIDDFGYPDHINSDVISVNEVAHKAHEAYIGEEIPFDASTMGPASSTRYPTGMIFPEDNPRPSNNPDKYKIPVTVPAPIIVLKNFDKATVKITWNQAAEEFTHDRLIGELDHYTIYRADFASGPWFKLDSVYVGDVDSEGIYTYLDDDQNFKLGETKFYAVTSVDVNANESGKTNFTEHEKDIASTKQLSEVHAVPNPFVVESGFTGSGEESKIGFYGLPKVCTIRIFSFSGQLIETIEHDADKFQEAWFQVSRNNQDIASGVYFYVVSTPEGDKATGKMIVIK